MAEDGDNKKELFEGDKVEDKEEGGVSEEDKIESEKIREEIGRKVREQYSSFESNIRNVFQERLVTMEASLDNTLTQKVTKTQLDVLKVNKTFREVSRPIGTRWKELFKELTSDLPEDQVVREMERIEKQSSPLLRPYKALMAWKEMKGDRFVVGELVGALERVGLVDLKEKAEEILMTKSSEDLIKFSTGVVMSGDVEGGVRKDGMGGGATASVSTVTRSCTSTTNQPSTTINQPSTTSNQPSTSSNQPSTTSNQPSTTSNQPSTTSNQSSTTTNSSTDLLNPEEALDDRHLLLLSKKMNDCWQKVAICLGVPQEQVDELIQAEGPTNYQAAFRMLYGWREDNSNLESLISALRHIGRPDLIKMLH